MLLASLGPGTLNLYLAILASLGTGRTLHRWRDGDFIFGLTVCALAELFRPDDGPSIARAIDRDSL